MIKINDYTKKTYNKDLKACTNEEIYGALLTMVQEAAREKQSAQVDQVVG